MCGIFGFLRYGADSIEDISSVEIKITELGSKAIERGRDSWGVVEVDDISHSNFQKGLGRFNDLKGHLGIVKKTTWVDIGYTLAEPTIECLRICGLECGVQNFLPGFGGG